MLFFVNNITDKPDWERKVHETDVIAKWRQEAKSLNWDEAGLPGGDTSDLMFEYVSEHILS